MFLDQSHSRGKRKANNTPAGEPVLVVSNHLGPQGAVVKLDASECKLVAHVSEGLTNREIAKKLRRSESSIKNQLGKVYKKLGVSRRVRLIMMFRS